MYSDYLWPESAERYDCQFRSVFDTLDGSAAEILVQYDTGSDIEGFTFSYEGELATVREEGYVEGGEKAVEYLHELLGDFSKNQ